MFLSKSCVQYKTLTFEEKVATIPEVEKGVKKKAQIAKDFQIPPNTLSTYLKNKEKNFEQYDKRKLERPKKGKRTGKCWSWRQCVLKWFKQARDKKERNNISFKSVCGESGSVDKQAAGVWKSEVLKMIKETPAKDIFNVDETGLFYKCMPNKTLTFKGDRCSGGKNSKEPEVTVKPIQHRLRH